MSTRILAIDPGARRLGLAVCDADRKIASPLANYSRKDPVQDGRYLRQVIADEGIGLIVIGLPVHGDGREGKAAIAARTFGAWVEKLTGLPVIYFDERYTTVEAEAVLWDAGLTHKKRKARRDQVAAQIILQSYLDAGCPKEPEIRKLDG